MVEYDISLYIYILYIMQCTVILYCKYIYIYYVFLNNMTYQQMRLQSLRHVSEQSVKIPSLPASPVTPPMLSEDAGKSLSTKVPESWTKETGLVFIRLGIPQNGWFMIKPLKWKILPPRPPIYGNPQMCLLV